MPKGINLGRARFTSGGPKMAGARESESQHMPT